MVFENFVDSMAVFSIAILGLLLVANVLTMILHFFPRNEFAAVWIRRLEHFALLFRIGNLNGDNLRRRR